MQQQATQSTEQSYHVPSIKPLGAVVSFWDSIGCASDDVPDQVCDKDVDQRTASALHLLYGGAWSRPRRLASVLRTLGSAVPRRLRTKRFQEVLRLLHQKGIEMRLHDADEPLAPNAPTPGIAAKVCLRV